MSSPRHIRLAQRLSSPEGRGSKGTKPTTTTRAPREIKPVSLKTGKSIEWTSDEFEPLPPLLGDGRRSPSISFRAPETQDGTSYGKTKPKPPRIPSSPASLNQSLTAKQSFASLLEQSGEEEQSAEDTLQASNSKYVRINKLRTRVKELEQKLLEAEERNVDYNALKSKLNDLEFVLNEAGYRELREQALAQNSRIRKLEKSLAQANVAIRKMTDRLCATRENDEAMIDSLSARLKREQSTNRVLSKKFCEVDGAMKLSVRKLTAAERKLDAELELKSVLKNEITEMTEKSRSDERIRQIRNQVRDAVRSMGRGAIETKMESLHSRLCRAEYLHKASHTQVEVLTKELRVSRNQLEGVFAQSQKKGHAAADFSIPDILESGTIVFRGSRLMDNRFVMFQVLERTDDHGQKSFTYIAYEPERSQEDYLTLAAADIRRLLVDTRPFLDPLPETHNGGTQELVQLLFKVLTISYKNGLLILSERSEAELTPLGSTKQCVNIYQGCPVLKQSDCDFLISVNEVSQEGFGPSWWLEIHAFDPVSEDELELKLDVSTIESICPMFTHYRPSQDKGNARSASIHRCFLEPIFDHLVVKEVDGHRRLLCTALQMVEAPTKAVPSNDFTSKTERKRARRIKPSIDHTATTLQPLFHRTVKLIQGIMYSVIVKEVWTLGFGVEVIAFDPDTENEMKCTVEANAISALMQYSFLKGQLHAALRPHINLTEGIPMSLQKLFIQFLEKRLAVGSSQHGTKNICLAELDEALELQSSGILRAEKLVVHPEYRNTIQAMGDIEARDLVTAVDMLRQKSDTKRLIFGRRMVNAKYCLVKVSSLSPLPLAVVILTCIGTSERHALLVPENCPVEKTLEQWNFDNAEIRRSRVNLIRFGAAIGNGARGLFKVYSGIANSVHMECFHLNTCTTTSLSLTGPICSDRYGFPLATSSRTQNEWQKLMLSGVRWNYSLNAIEWKEP